VSVVCPVTFNVPLEVSEEVAVILPEVRELNTALTAFNTDAKKFVDVAFVDAKFVVVAFVARRDVTVAFVALSVVTIASCSVEEAATRRVM